MPIRELPHTAGCLVCGRENPHGLHLSLAVDPDSGIVSVPFTPGPRHIGFEGIVHGGVIATVIDEAMVWAATWAGRRFCVCGEMSVRFRASATVGGPLLVTARVDEPPRPRLIHTSATVATAAGQTIATGTGKYVPVTLERHADVVRTLVPDPVTQFTAAALRGESA